jgi:branched-subunit amino acid ABC-type transport system permease component
MLQTLFNGLVSGTILSLPALALALSFSVLRFANFAIGALITVGAYVVYGFNVLLGWPMTIAVPAGMLMTAFVAVLSDLAVFLPLRKRASITLLVASMGLSLVLENGVRTIAGSAALGYNVDPMRPWRIGGLRIDPQQIWAMVIVAAALLIVSLIYRKTRLGRAMRALADDPDLAGSRGVRPAVIVAYTWAIVGALAAVAGVLIGLDTSVDPSMGWNYLLPTFAAAILGGIGSPAAAVGGAVVLGVVQEAATLVIPPHYRSLVAFIVMTVLLLVRPSGLFGARWIKR